MKNITVSKSNMYIKNVEKGGIYTQHTSLFTLPAQVLQLYEGRLN
jgi:hypothetical protein